MIFVHVMLLLLSSSHGLNQRSEPSRLRLVRFPVFFSLHVVALERHPWILMLELKDHVYQIVLVSLFDISSCYVAIRYFLPWS